jgi:hypothetical protein
MRIFRSKGRCEISSSYLVLYCERDLRGTAFVGYKAALRISYRHSEARAFNSLGKQDTQELRTTLQTLTFLSQSHLVTKLEPSPADYHSALALNIPALQKLRDRAPERLRPPIDLQLAVDYAEMAHLEQEANHLEEATKARQSAQGLLRSLGWKDVSPDALNRVAVQEIQPLRIWERKQ